MPSSPATNRGHARAGALIRGWRREQHLSQLDLAGRAEVSTRHISYVENGRSQATRDMLHRLAAALRLSPRQRNDLLLAGGYAPAHGETSFDAPEMEALRGLVKLVLDHHQPYAAVAMSAAYDLLLANAAAQTMTAQFCAEPAALLAEGPANLLRTLCHPAGMRGAIKNWPEVVAACLARVRRELELEERPGLRAIMEEVVRYPGVRACLDHYHIGETPPLLIPLILALPNGREVRLTTTVSTLGTAMDITLQDLRIESYYPADAESAAVLRELSA